MCLKGPNKRPLTKASYGSWCMHLGLGLPHIVLLLKISSQVAHILFYYKSSVDLQKQQDKKFVSKTSHSQKETNRKRKILPPIWER